MPGTKIFAALTALCILAGFFVPTAMSASQSSNDNGWSSNFSRPFKVLSDSKIVSFLSGNPSISLALDDFRFFRFSSDHQRLVRGLIVPLLFDQRAVMIFARLHSHTDINLDPALDSLIDAIDESPWVSFLVYFVVAPSYPIYETLSNMSSESSFDEWFQFCFLFCSLLEGVRFFCSVYDFVVIYEEIQWQHTQYLKSNLSLRGHFLHDFFRRIRDPLFQMLILQPSKVALASMLSYHVLWNMTDSSFSLLFFISNAQLFALPAWYIWGVYHSVKYSWNCMARFGTTEEQLKDNIEKVKELLKRKEELSAERSSLIAQKEDLQRQEEEREGEVAELEIKMKELQEKQEKSVDKEEHEKQIQNLMQDFARRDLERRNAHQEKIAKEHERGIVEIQKKMQEHQNEKEKFEKELKDLQQKSKEGNGKAIVELEKKMQELEKKKVKDEKQMKERMEVQKQALESHLKSKEDIERRMVALQSEKGHFEKQFQVLKLRNSEQQKEKEKLELRLDKLQQDAKEHEARAEKLRKMCLSGIVRKDDVTFEKKLTQGGFGCVYQAKMFGKDIAVKCSVEDSATKSVRDQILLEVKILIPERTFPFCFQSVYILSLNHSLCFSDFNYEAIEASKHRRYLWMHRTSSFAIVLKYP
jgi:hypothetical protein